MTFNYSTAMQMLGMVLLSGSLAGAGSFGLRLGGECQAVSVSTAKTQCLCLAATHIQSFVRMRKL